MIFGNYPFVICAILIVLGLYTLLFKHNLIKIVIGINLLEAGVNLFLVSLAFRADSTAPIFTYAPQEKMSLPTPHALTLTSIVIGLAVTALLLSFGVLIFRSYGTLDSEKVNQLRG
ncbi:MAG: sodium:proton antiporter [Candidatus Bipolaricaulota bacterium]